MRVRINSSARCAGTGGEVKESVNQEMGKAKDIEQRVGNMEGRMLDLEEQVTKGHSNYEHVMKELTEMKDKVSNELNEVKRNVNAGNNPDFESYREVLQREVKHIQ